jgi:hypothetical protein
MRAVIFGYFIFRSHRRNPVPGDIAPTDAPSPPPIAMIAAILSPMSRPSDRIPAAPQRRRSGGPATSRRASPH